MLEQTINGATGVLLNITGGESLTLQEVHEAADVIYNTVDPNANIVFGSVINDSMGDDLAITVIATGFHGESPSLSQLKSTVLNTETPLQSNVQAQTETQKPVIDFPFNASSLQESSETVENIAQQQEVSEQSNVQTETNNTDTVFTVPAAKDSEEHEFDLDVPAFLRDIK